ncbi:MAG TPA: hypothetical protein VGM30_13635 [Puia sp.]|jgi:hypothetical protein
MRWIAILGLFFVLAGCGGQSKDPTAGLQDQIDSLRQKLNNTYAPGLGEFMSGIQVHHAKLWFAGKSGNWQLAGFEIGEIKETIDDISKFCTDRPEISSLPMINPALDSVSAAIAHGDAAAFNRGFVVLTQTCNNCHRATKHAFNVIKIPDTAPFTNQSFDKPHDPK